MSDPTQRYRTFVGDTLKTRQTELNRQLRIEITSKFLFSLEGKSANDVVTGSVLHGNTERGKVKITVKTLFIDQMFDDQNFYRYRFEERNGRLNVYRMDDQSIIDLPLETEVSVWERAYQQELDRRLKAIQYLLRKGADLNAHVYDFGNVTDNPNCTIADTVLDENLRQRLNLPPTGFRNWAERLSHTASEPCTGQSSTKPNEKRQAPPLPKEELPEQPEQPPDRPRFM